MGGGKKVHSTKSSKQNDAYVIPRLTLLLLPVICWRILRGRVRSIHYLKASRFSMLILKGILGETHISQILPTGHLQIPVYGQALDLIDEVYMSAFKQALDTAFNRDHDSMLEKMLKKEITSDLAETLYFLKFSQSISEQASFILVDSRVAWLGDSILERVSGRAQTANGFLYRLDKVSLVLQAHLTRLMHLFIPIALLCFALINLFKRTFHRSFRFAIIVHNINHQFKARGKYLDFLVDDEIIKNEDTVFLQLRRIPDELMEAIGNRSLNISPYLGYWETLREASSRDILKCIPEILSYLRIEFSHTASKQMVTVMQVALMNTLRWQLIRARYSFEHLITFNDEQISHIARNSVLRKSGVECWYYSHSAAMGYSSNPRSNPIEKRHILWSYLDYDHFITWNQAMKSYIKSHPVFFTKTSPGHGHRYAEGVQQAERLSREIRRLLEAESTICLWRHDGHNVNLTKRSTLVVFHVFCVFNRLF